MVTGQRSAFVVVGRVRRAHGVQGEVSVDVTSDVPGRFSRGAILSVAPVGAQRRPLEIAAVRSRSGQMLVKFVGIDDRDQAQQLRGVALEVALEEVPRSPDGAYYYYQLIGCRCIDATAGPLGVVDDVIEDGGGLLLSVAASGGQLLVPFVESYLAKIDVEHKVIELELPDGLLELCVSRS